MFCVFGVRWEFVGCCRRGGGPLFVFAGGRLCNFWDGFDRGIFVETVMGMTTGVILSDVLCVQYKDDFVPCKRL